MVQTRSGGQTTGATEPNSTPQKKQQQQQKKTQQHPKQTSTTKRNSKKTDKNTENSQNNSTDSLDKKIHKIIADYGSLPLQDTDIANKPLKPTTETVLAMVLDAMLKSTRISHELAQKAVNTVIQAGYHDIQTLRQTSWDDRVAVLAEGGYNRYREQTATRLGELVELIDEEYDGDLNNLLKQTDGNVDQIKKHMKQIKGMGDLAAELFLDNVQAVWHRVAPFLDSRSLDTAEEVGLGRDVNVIYEELDKDPVEMSKLARGLSAVRLHRRQGEIEAEG